MGAEILLLHLSGMRLTREIHCFVGAEILLLHLSGMRLTEAPHSSTWPLMTACS